MPGTGRRCVVPGCPTEPEGKWKARRKVAQDENFCSTHLLDFSICGCSKDYVDDSKPSFHVFPSDSELRKIWIKLIGLDPKYVPNKNAHVCSRHFEFGGGRKMPTMNISRTKEEISSILGNYATCKIAISRSYRSDFATSVDGGSSELNLPNAWSGLTPTQSRREAGPSSALLFDRDDFIWPKRKNVPGVWYQGNGLTVSSLRQVPAKVTSFPYHPPEPSSRNFAQNRPQPFFHDHEYFGDVVGHVQPNRQLAESTASGRQTANYGGCSSSRWLCQASVFADENVFEFFTGISLEIFDIVCAQIEERFPNIIPANTHHGHILSTLDWPKECLFYFLMTQRRRYPNWFMRLKSKLLTIESCQILLYPILGELLKPLVRWAPIARNDFPPGFCLTTELEERLENENAVISGLLTIVTRKMGSSRLFRTAWNASFVVIFNFHGAVMYRSRVYWWEMYKDHFPDDNQKKLYARILASCYDERLGNLLDSRRVLLTSSKLLDFGNSIDWLWPVRDNSKNGRRFKQKLIGIGSRLRKSFDCFWRSKLNSFNTQFLNETVAISCGLVNLMPRVDWEKLEVDEMQF